MDRPRPDSHLEAGDAFRQLLEAAPDATVGVGRDGRILLANRRAEELFGYGRGELVGESVEALVPERFRKSHRGQRRDYFAAPRPRPMGADLELYGRRRDGTEFPAKIALSSIEVGGQTLVTAAVRDISERAESERERLLQRQRERARRLESLGQLAGGIAHDFNNLLGVIMNYGEFVAAELNPNSEAHRDLEEIRRAAERAAALTRQLLIFSRREVARPEVLDLGRVIGELQNLLQRALGERVELEVRLADGLWPIEADPRRWSRSS